MENEKERSRAPQFQECLFFFKKKKRTGTVKSFGYGISLSDVGKVFHPILTLDVVAEKGEITNN